MERKEFVTLLGLGAGAVVVHACLGACGKGGATPAPVPGPNGKVDFTITNIASNSDIQGKGYMVQNSIVIATTANGYFAVSGVCTHLGAPISFTGTVFYCNPATGGHGSQFNTDGSVKVGPANTPLKSYSTQLLNGGADLRVYEV
ncbi:MAG: ubiquinol-cytochrome c reductase iron-sulfur subunit [Sphingobacteriaceae bacterium]